MSSSDREKKDFLSRPLRLLLIGIAPILFLWLAWSGEEARKTTSNRIIDWLPTGIEETRVFYEYYYHFPEGELLMVSWDGCRPDDERLDAIAEKLSAPWQGTNAQGKIVDYPPCFDRVLTTRSALAEMRAPPLEFSQEEAESRLSGWLIGRNGEACLVALISQAGGERRAQAIDAVYKAVEEIVGLSRPEIHIAGPTIDSVAIDEISARSQKTLLPFFLSFCFVLLLLCLRSFVSAGIVFAVALMNEEMSIAVLYWCGGHVDSISMLIGSLVFVLTISAGVHLINYYRETLQETSLSEAPRKAVRKAALPCTLAVLTTVLGFISLAISKMVPIRNFGIFSSVALIIGTMWLFLLLPSLLQEWPIRRWRRQVLEHSTRSLQYRLSQFWGVFALFIRRFHIAITVGSLGLMIVLAFGVRDLKTTVTFHGMFPDSAKVIQDYNALEKTVGGLIPIEVVLCIPDAGNESLSILDQLYLLDAARESLGRIPEVDTTISALNFTPDLPPRNVPAAGAAARRRVFTRFLPRYVDQFKEARFYNRVDETLTFEGIEGFDGTEKIVAGNYWRLSLRIPAHAKIDYAKLLAALQDRLDHIHESAVAAKINDLRFLVTGGVPLVHRAQAQLLRDLIDSFTSAFGLIALTMILMLRGIRRGLISMVPNLFPCVIVFGTMGWVGYPVDMGSMMTASVAMGIAVDGTLHYITWFYDGLQRGKNRHESIVYAYRQCATALTETTIICGFGMLIFGLSDFIPVSQFAVMLFLLLTTALIGDIVVLPAMLCGPLGRVFETKAAAANKEENADVDAGTDTENARLV